MERFLQNIKKGSADAFGTLKTFGEAAGYGSPVLAARNIMDGKGFSNFFPNAEKNTQQALDFQEKLGADPVDQQKLQRSDQSGGLVNAFQQGIADPTSLFGAAKAIPALSRVAASGVSGSLAQGGSEVGQGLGRQIEGGSGDGTLPTALGIAGAIIGGGAGAPSRVLTATALDKTITVGKKIAHARKNVNEATEAAALSSSEGLMRTIAEVHNIEDIGKVSKQFNSMKEYFNEGELKSFPILALWDNPVVRDSATRLIKNNPKIRGQIEDELTRLTDLVDKKATDVFGETCSTAGTEVSKVSAKRLEDIRAQITHTDSTLEKLGDRMRNSESPENIGKAVSTTIAKREKIVREEMSEVYDGVFKQAEKINARLPSDGSQQIFDFVRQNKMEDIFGKTSRVENLITKHFTPSKSFVKNEFLPKSMSRGKGQAVNTFPTVSFSNLDSLKREINATLRKNLNPTEQRRVLALKSVVDDAFEKGLPPELYASYKDADLQFVQKLGIPYNKQGIIDISSQKYMDSVAPTLTKHPEAMRDFLKVAGGDATSI